MSLFKRVERFLNRAHTLAGKPFDPSLSFAPPQGRYATVHYGMMLAGLPEPFRFVDVIAVMGQPNCKLFRNDHLITTNDADTSNLLVGSGVSDPDAFKGYHTTQGIQASPDGNRIVFGDGDLIIEREHPRCRVRRTRGALTFDLELTATDKVSHFVKLIGGQYDHWSLLCQYKGTLTYGGKSTAVSGLANLEYARATRIPLPLRFFTYHILNLDDKTQLLMTVNAGPRGVPVVHGAYVRGLDDYGTVSARNLKFDIDGFEPHERTTPNGLTMRLPRKFHWSVDERSGAPLAAIAGEINNDFVYGMAGGYAGSYRYSGTFRGRDVSGTGYVEFIGNP